MLHTMFISWFRTHTQLFMPQGSHFEVQILLKRPKISAFSGIFVDFGPSMPQKWSSISTIWPIIDAKRVLTI